MAVISRSHSTTFGTFDLLFYKLCTRTSYYSIKNARAGFGMHAKAEQVQKKIKFGWLTLVWLTTN